MRSQALRSAGIRVGALRLLFLVVFVVVAGRAIHLSLIDSQGKRRGEWQIQAHIALPGARGLILDRSRRELAIAVDAPSIYVLPHLLDDRERSLAALAKLLQIDRRRLARRVDEHEGFTFIARWVSDAQAEQIGKLALAGVGIEREPRRSYPAGRLAAPLLGFVDIDGKGVRGVEQMMDSWLKGKPRRLAVERDATGKLLCGGPLDPRVAAGGDVMLSIDAGLQAEAEAALGRTVEQSGALGGLVIAIDPRTGDVLSLAEAPGFDPNDFRHTGYEKTRSRAFLDALEPGSTLKAFLVAAALEAGTLHPDDRIDTGEGWLSVPGKTIRDHHAYGVIDAAGVLRYSSNVAAVQIAQQLGRERHFAALQRFGFGRRSDSGFPTESVGLLRDWRKWKPVDHATLAFGQGISITPIQLAMAVASLANGGELMQPRLVLARRRSMGRWRRTNPASRGQVVSHETAEKVLGMLETVVSGEGTGRLAALAGVRVAGKTGTAQKLDRETGRYSRTRYTAWFMGVAPADDPRLAIVVALDEPRRTAHTGGAVAAPLFAQVASAQLARRGIITHPEPIPAEPLPTWSLGRRESTVEESQPQQRPATPSVERAGLTRSVAPPTDASDAPPGWTNEASRAHLRSVLVPDFYGENLASAKQLAAQESLDLRVLGSYDGRVSEQSPAPGTIVGGSKRTVVLNFTTGREEG